MSSSPSRRARRAAARARLYVPDAPGVDWSAVAKDQTVPLVVTNCPEQALRLCQAGTPALAITGLSKADVAAVLRSYGADVIQKKDAH